MNENAQPEMVAFGVAITKVDEDVWNVDLTSGIFSVQLRLTEQGMLDLCTHFAGVGSNIVAARIIKDRSN